MSEHSEERDGVLSESGKFLETGRIESNLTLIGFQETETPKRQKNGEYELKAYICTKDASKPYLERQRILAESIEMPQQSWSQIQNSWNEFMGIQILLEGLGTESEHFAPAREHYKRARADRKARCEARLHWNPGRKTAYSDIAFSKLSGSIRMEKSPCKGRGISLAYNGDEPECESHGGPYGCSYLPSLLIASCDGAKSQLLESPAPIKGFGQKEEIAMEKLQDKLRKENFWKEWEQEIKQWSPQCE